MATRLHRAMERDEFVLHYQPVLDLQAGGVVGVEALIRWHDPERGLVAARRLHPAGRAAGPDPADLGLGDRRRRSPRPAAGMRDGLDLEMAVNLPPVLWQPALVQQLSAELETHGIDAPRC